VVAVKGHLNYCRKHKIGEFVTGNISRAKKARGVAQAIEHLTYKYKALGSNQSTAKKGGEMEYMTTRINYEKC
jgi:hypothetical protein